MSRERRKRDRVQKHKILYAINSLDSAVITEILINLHPKNVISSAFICRKFASAARNRQVFQKLLETHYPSAFLTSNPRQQYIAITEGVETTYRILNLVSKNAVATGNVSEIYVSEIDASEIYVPEIDVNSDNLCGRLLIGKSSRPEASPGWTLYESPASRFRDLLNNEQFQIWLKKDQKNHWKALEIAEKVNTPLFMGPDDFRTWLRAACSRQDLSSDDSIPWLQYIEENFLAFVKSLRSTTKFSALDEQSIIKKTLKDGRSNIYKWSCSKVTTFTIAGNSIPCDTAMWVIVCHHDKCPTENTAAIYRTRKEMASSFSRLLPTLNKYLTGRKKSPLSYTKETLYQHVMTNDKFVLNDDDADYWYIWYSFHKV